MKFRLVISGNGDEQKVRQIASEARAYMEGEKITIHRATLQADGKSDSEIAAADATRGGRPTSQTSENPGGTVTDPKPTGEGAVPGGQQQPPPTEEQPPQQPPEQP